MTHLPVRIQRQRVKGWRTPTCGCGCGQPASYVGRPTFWGNPFQPVFTRGEWWARDENGVEYPLVYGGRPDALLKCVSLYHCEFVQGSEKHLRLDELRGHDLTCWCPLDQPCHGDVLLVLANWEES